LYHNEEEYKEAISRNEDIIVQKRAEKRIKASEGKIIVIETTSVLKDSSFRLTERRRKEMKN
jgi:hypothetical protein